MSAQQAVGALGKPRSIGKSILLAVVMLGIYTFVWTYKTHEEMKIHSGEGVGGVVGLVIYILIGPVTYFVVPSEVSSMYELEQRESPVRGITGLWILLPLFGSIVWFVKVQRALNEYWMSKAAPAP